MLTRSRVSLKDVKIKELLLGSRDSCAPRKQKPFKICIFDTESYSLQTKNRVNGNDDKALPTQIAWGIYEVNGKNMTKISNEMYYIAEVWVLSKYRDILDKSKYFTINTKLKHEKHMESTSYPLMNAKSVLDKLKNALKDCTYVAAFNIKWDNDAIQYLIAELDLQILNPLGSVKQIDIMHMCYQNFDRDLVKNGVDNNIITKEGKKRYKKGICTAQNMYKVIVKNSECNECIQTHLADSDVEIEKELVDYCLKKKGSLEYDTKKKARLYQQVQALCKEMYPVVPVSTISCVSCNDLIPDEEQKYEIEHGNYHCDFCHNEDVVKGSNV